MIDDVVAAVRAGRQVVVPTDTVYGLAADAYREAPVRRLYEVKGRAGSQPVALVAASVEVLLEAVPELDPDAEGVARALLPGPYTLVLPNPERRFQWLTGNRPTTIGVRVPALTGPAAALFEEVGALAATSANRPGGPDPRTVSEVPDEVREACAAVLDVGPLPGTPSTVIDLTGPEPSVIREGAVPAEEALARLSAVRG